MTSSDQRKLLKAGFTILRTDENNLRIKNSFGNSAWSTFEGNFKNKTALRRRMKELLESDKIIES